MANKEFVFLVSAFQLGAIAARFVDCAMDCRCLNAMS